MFSALVISGRSTRPRRAPAAISFLLHAAAIGAFVLVPIFWPSPLPEQPDPIRALLYDPPPPPPPPLRLGSEFTRRAPTPVALAPPVAVPRAPTRLTVALETPARAPTAEAGDSAEIPGSPTGSPFGDELGMEGGVEGGVVGGIPGGVLGGVIGGMGDIPLTEPVVRDPDRPPRLLRQVRPRYPDEAFVKKIEGTVVVEIVIGADGRVARARVVKSVPVLDAAALEAVRQWVFAPAWRGGRPVATLATAPIRFTIY